MPSLCRWLGCFLTLYHMPPVTLRWRGARCRQGGFHSRTDGAGTGHVSIRNARVLRVLQDVSRGACSVAARAWPCGTSAWWGRWCFWFPTRQVHCRRQPTLWSTELMCVAWPSRGELASIRPCHPTAPCTRVSLSVPKAWMCWVSCRDSKSVRLRTLWVSG